MGDNTAVNVCDLMACGSSQTLHQRIRVTMLAAIKFVTYA